MYKKLIRLSEHSPFLIFPRIPVIFHERRSFLLFKVVLLRLELSRDTTFATKIGQSVADLKLTHY